MRGLLRPLFLGLLTRARQLLCLEERYLPRHVLLLDKELTQWSGY